MPEHINNLDLAKNINDAIVKLQNGEASIDQLEDMVMQARELYERLLVLRFKAYEQKVRPQLISNPDKQDSDDARAFDTEFNKIEEVIPKEDDMPFDFSLFGEVKTEQQRTPTPPDSLDPITQTTSKVEPEQDPSPIEASTLKVNIKSETIPASASILDKLNNGGSSERLGDKLKNSKLESLSSAFTLNDRIRFTKNLFDNNGDTFNAAIQLLDAQKNLQAAKDLVQDYATRYEWDMEEKNTLDFIELIDRRYA